MKLIVVRIALLGCLLFANEFVLVHLDDTPPISTDVLLIIRAIDVVLIALLAASLIAPDWFATLGRRGGRARSDLGRGLRLVAINLAILILLDQTVCRMLGLGYQVVTRQNHERHPHPYDMFRARPNVLDHNELGFRGAFPDPGDLDPDTFTFAFFGGSTGYNGEPPIADLISASLTERGITNQSYNLSSSASMHTAHLHRLLQVIDKYQFDAIIFYGGGNEGLLPVIYDPRAGYPFNFFMTEEVGLLRRWALRMSPLLGEIDKITGGALSGQRALRARIMVPHDAWFQSLLDQYMQNRALAERMTNRLVRPHRCESARFYSVFQPANPMPMARDHWDRYRAAIRATADGPGHLHLADLEPDMVFTDFIHVDQPSRVRLADEIGTWFLATDPCLAAASPGN